MSRGTATLGALLIGTSGVLLGISLANGWAVPAALNAFALCFNCSNLVNGTTASPNKP